MPTPTPTIPTVVIVGRPNVGKSSLLNMLAGRRISIVDDMAGVTRDRVSAPMQIPGTLKHLQIIDTGGYGIEDVQNLTAQIQQQIASGLAQADIILFVIDAKQGVVTLDRKVASVLREYNLKTKKVIPVANKVDSENQHPGAYEMTELGFGHPVIVSATTGHNKHELYERLNKEIDTLPTQNGNANSKLKNGTSAPDTGLLIAIAGKRNAGKSTLINALAGQQRVIVSEKQGTTRDSIDVSFEFEGKTYTAIDTAGVRKTKSIKTSIDFYSHHRSLRSVRRCSVCLLIIDSTVPVSQVDRQLVKEALDHYKPVVIVVNKWDLAEKKHSQQEYGDYLTKQLKGLRFAPIVFTSATNSEGLKEALEMASEVYSQATTRITTGKLNQAIEQITAQRGPSSPGGKRAKIYYATQLDVAPPSIAMFVNDPTLFDDSYQRYLINNFRDLLPFPEVPIKLSLRPRRAQRELT